MCGAANARFAHARMFPGLGLTNARRHLMIRLKIPAGMIDKLTVGRMTDRLDAYDLGAQRRHMTVNMLHELCLRVCGSRDEHGTRIRDGLGHALKKFVVFRRMSAADGVRFMMNMARWLLGVEHEAIDL